MRFLPFALPPLLLVAAGSVHAQSLSRAIPPESASIKATFLQIPVAQPVQHASSARTQPLEPLLAVRGLRASAALPPDSASAAAQPATVVQRAPVQPALVDAKALAMQTAMRQSSSDDSDDASQTAVRPARASGSGLDGDVRCVAQAVFHEARGESVQGQRAVADVVMNRARSGRWGGSACAVVNAPSQFSNRWSWHAPQLGVAAWDRAISIARDAVAGAVGVSSHLMNFRAASMGAGSLRALRIGNHVFW